MPLKFASSLTLVALLSAGAPAMAQPLANGALAEEVMFDGALVFRGDGAISDRVDQDGKASFHFWRPVLYPAKPWPIAGRMDCDISAQDTQFSPELFDLQARYDAVRESRRDKGLKDDDALADLSETVRRIDVAGHVQRPLRRYVVSYIALRDETRLYDIRMDCTFMQGDGAGKPNNAALVHYYTSFSLGVAQFNSAGENKS